MCILCVLEVGSVATFTLSLAPSFQQALQQLVDGFLDVFFSPPSHPHTVRVVRHGKGRRVKAPVRLQCMVLAMHSMLIAPGSPGRQM